MNQCRSSKRDGLLVSFIAAYWFAFSVLRSEAAQSCLTLSDPMDCSLPDSSHGIFQARVLEWVAMAFFTFSALHWSKFHVRLLQQGDFLVSK